MLANIRLLLGVRLLSKSQAVILISPFSGMTIGQNYFDTYTFRTLTFFMQNDGLNCVTGQ